ncbi:MAG: peptidylprolyl isomerase [Candidatus Micrarchaeia archaeon]|jgi:FKBP-type peptidyl-prolyl cis-trans isomerase 2
MVGFKGILAISLVFILFASLSGCASQGNGAQNQAAPPSAPPVELEKGDIIANMNIAAANGDTVSVNYIGKLTSGKLFDTNIKEEAQKAGFPLRPSYAPLSFKVGAGQMIPGFDAGVVGMKIGEEKTVTLSPDQAYGQRTDEAIISIPLANIGNSSGIVVGSMLYAQSGQSGKVVEINSTHAKVDFNHELAGETLIFTIRMVNITKR